MYTYSSAQTKLVEVYVSKVYHDLIEEEFSLWILKQN